MHWRAVPKISIQQYTTVASVVRLQQEVRYVREFRDFMQVTSTAVRNLPAYLYVIGFGSLCYRLIMFTVLSVNIY